MLLTHANLDSYIRVKLAAILWPFDPSFLRSGNACVLQRLFDRPNYLSCMALELRLRYFVSTDMEIIAVRSAYLRENSTRMTYK